MAAFPSSPFLQNSSHINLDQPNTAFHNLDHLCNNEEHSVFSVTNKNSMDSSSVVTHKYCAFTTQNTPPSNLDSNKTKTSKHSSSSSPNSAQSKDMREVKVKKQRKLVKDCGEKKEAPTGYIHVRARRGQATDSHSLAERVRRERISERMKQLQSLVPGCDKVTGKALMLDEIINYVQSLQNQVEFLSMKLASVNPMLYDFGMDLESLMVRPDQSLSSLASPFEAGMQEFSSTTANTYNLLDNSSNSFMLQQQSQIPYAIPQGEKQVFWGEDEQSQIQKIINQSGFNNNNLFSFP